MTSVKHLQKLLKTKSLDAFLVSSYAHVSYLTGFYGFSQFERDAYVLVTPKNIYLFTNPLYKDSFDPNSKSLLLKITSRDNPLTKQLHYVLQIEHIKSVGFEEENLTVSEFTKLQKDGIDFIPDTLSHLRIKKSHDEIQRIKSVCKLTDIVFEEFVKQTIEPGITEVNLATRLEKIALEKNASFSFPAIVAFGKNAAIPHHHSGETKLKKNDLILIDFGLKKDNYCSDMTRTFFIGKPTEEQKKAYAVVLESQQVAVQQCNNVTMKQSTSVSAKNIDKAVRDYITSHNFPTIPHSLGHGIGLEVHEAPSLSPHSEDKLTEGMVFSIEPGIYLPGKFGIRIEDLYTIQNGNLTKLTNSKSDLTVL